MKQLKWYLAVILLVACTSQGAREGDYKQFGALVGEGSSVDVSAILGSPEAFVGKTVLLEGIAGSVCQNRGCWMYVTDGKSKVRMTFKDYGFFVPFGSEGKRVRAEGIVLQKLVSKETLQHWEEEEEGGDPSSISDDQTVVMFEASGVMIEGGGDLSLEQTALMSKD